MEIFKGRQAGVFFVFFFTQEILQMNSQNGSTGHTAGGHFIHTVRHVHVLDHGPFTDIVSALAI